MSKPKAVIDLPKFGIQSSTILFLEGPQVAGAKNIRNMIDAAMKTKFVISFDVIRENFTIDTDGAAVMVRMAGSSVSRNVALLSERWMRCYSHTFHNSMKQAIHRCASDSTLVKVSDDFKSMKKLRKTLSAIGGTPSFQLVSF